MALVRFFPPDFRRFRLVVWPGCNTDVAGPPHATNRALRSGRGGPEPDVIVRLNRNG
jgi:hypothetical protein